MDEELQKEVDEKNKELQKEIDETFEEIKIIAKSLRDKNISFILCKDGLLTMSSFRTMGDRNTIINGIEIEKKRREIENTMKAKSYIIEDDPNINLNDYN